MFDVYYNEKKNWFEFDMNKHDFSKALEEFSQGVCYHLPDGSTYCFELNKKIIESSMLLKPSFLNRGSIIFNRKNERPAVLKIGDLFGDIRLTSKQYKIAYPIIQPILKRLGTLHEL